MQRFLLHGRIARKLSEYMLSGALGGTIYYTCEVFFRGFSHWSMFLLGALVMVFATWQGDSCCWKDSLLIQAGRCLLLAVSGEFITGVLVNLLYNWHVWDYHTMPFHLFGQICLPFMGLFYFLCIFAVMLAKQLSRQIFH